MHGHHDSDHYDVQFTTRQLVMLFGLLIVIVVGVFVGGIVIGRGMAPGAAEAMMARRTSPTPVPPPAATPAATSPAATRPAVNRPAVNRFAAAEAPADDALRLPIRSEPQPAAKVPAPAPAEKPTPAARPAAPAPTRAAPAPAPAARAASTSPEQLANRTLAAARPRAAANPAPAGVSDRPKPAATGKFTIQVAALRDRAGAERLLEQLAARGIEGYLEGTPAGIFRVRVGRFESREAARALAARLESEQFATLVTSR